MNVYSDNYEAIFKEWGDFKSFLESNPIKWVPLQSGRLRVTTKRKGNSEAEKETAFYLNQSRKVKETIPLSEPAVRQLVTLMGVDCPLWSKLPNDKKEELLNLAFRCADNRKIRIPIRFEKARGAVSDRYIELKAEDVFQRALDVLPEVFSDTVEFHSGCYQHSLSTITLFSKPDNLHIYKDQLEKMGVKEDLSDMKVEVEISTSETAEGTVRCALFLQTKTHRILLGSPVQIRHMGMASLQKWENSLDLLTAASDDFMKSIVRLQSNTLSYPKNTYISLGKAIGLSKKALAASYDYLETTGDTALAVYFALADAVNNTCKTAKNITTKISLQENLARALRCSFPWENYDTPLD